MAATMKQIAELAGVSVGTVDRALNNRGRISPEVKQRILDIAKAVNYTPNLVAKSLSVRRKNLKLGFVLHAQHNYFHDTIIAGVQRAAAELADFGVEILIQEAENNSAADQLRRINALLEENVSGIAICPVDDDNVRKKLKEIHDSGIPIVFVGGFSSNPNCLCHVGQDSHQKGRIIANLLSLVVSQCQLLVFSAPLHIFGPKGVLRSLHESIATEYKDIILEDVIELSDDEFSNYEISKAALASHPNANAVLFASVSVAGSLRALREVEANGRAIRAVTTFCSPEVQHALANGLIDASVWCDQELTGYQSIRVLFDYLVGDQMPQRENIFAEQHISLKQSI